MVLNLLGSWFAVIFLSLALPGTALIFWQYVLNDDHLAFLISLL
jgi:hypothetical protein